MGLTLEKTHKSTSPFQFQYLCFHSRMKEVRSKNHWKNWSNFVLWLAWSTTCVKLFSEFCYTIWVNSCLLSNINHCWSDPIAALSLIVLQCQVCSLFSAQFLALMTFLALAKEGRQVTHKSRCFLPFSRTTLSRLKAATAKLQGIGCNRGNPST